MKSQVYDRLTINTDRVSAANHCYMDLNAILNNSQVEVDKTGR